MTEPRLAGLIAHLPEGVTEIYTHPATASGFAGAAPGYRYEEELAALTSPDFATRCARLRSRTVDLQTQVDGAIDGENPPSIGNDVGLCISTPRRALTIPRTGFRDIPPSHVLDNRSWGPR